MQQTLTSRVGVLERKMEGLEGLPDRVASLESQILQFRGDVRVEFSAVCEEMHRLAETLRQETRAGDEETRREMHELHGIAMTRMQELHDIAMARTNELHEIAMTKMQALHDTALTQMRVLHEDVISRVALLNESLNGRMSPRRTRGRKRGPKSRSSKH